VAAVQVIQVTVEPFGGQVVVDRMVRKLGLFEQGGGDADQVCVGIVSIGRRARPLAEGDG